MVRRHLILRVTTKLLMPFVLLFALYVQFHGDYGPGGGFQAGVIFAAGFILYALIYGVDAARRVVRPGFLTLMMATGLLLFIGVGYASLFLGANFLDYDVLAQKPKEGQYIGILLVEFGVGVTVAATMMTIFFTFATRRNVSLRDDQR